MNMDYEKLFAFLDAARKSFDMLYEIAKEEYETTGELSEEVQEALNTMLRSSDYAIGGGLDSELIDEFIAGVDEITKE